jgi:hypothetical protein
MNGDPDLHTIFVIDNQTQREGGIIHCHKLNKLFEQHEPNKLFELEISKQE